MDEKKIEKKIEEKKLSFLENGNSVTLQGGKVIFGGIKNWQSNDSYLRACKDRDVNSLRLKEERDEMKYIKNQEWLLTHIVHNGVSFLKSNLVEKTFTNIQDLDEMDGQMLGTAIGEYMKLRESEIKKKSR